MNPDCCDQGLIEWHTAHPEYGPEADGWAMPYGMTDYGAAHCYVNVAYCPFCGKDLSLCRGPAKDGAQ